MYLVLLGTAVAVINNISFVLSGNSWLLVRGFSHLDIKFYFFKIFDGHMSLNGATDTSAFGLWSPHLLTSKPEGQPYSHLAGVYMMYIP